MKINISESEKEVLLTFWIGKRNYARDCRWIAKHVTKNKFRFGVYNRQYKDFDKRIKELRKAK